jgi:(p)ppGpp synthase/HD superfamily hydrolase
MAKEKECASPELWQKAAGFAARAHQHQKRRDGKTPYVSHVFRVAMTVRHVFGCDDAVCLVAALLHDTIEDTGTDFDEIAENFGHDVAACVAALTKNMALPEKEREAEYDRRLAAADWRARLVKLADQFDNLSDTPGEEPAFCSRAIARAERALKIAAADAGNPYIKTAMDAVKGVINQARRRLK